MRKSAVPEAFMKQKISTKNKVLIIVIISVYVILLLALASVILEGVGSFAGEWLNTPVVSGYMTKNYPDIDYRIEDTYFKNESEQNVGFEVKTKGYSYVCRVMSVKEGAYGTLSKGDVFVIKAYNYKVYYDQIFSEYNCDKELSEAINEKLLETMKNYYAGGGYLFTPFKVYADTVPGYDEFSDYKSIDQKVDAAIDAGVVGRGSLILYVKGEKISYEEYKHNISYVVDFYSESAPGSDGKLVPAGLQIFYYYTDENGEDVPQYESQLTAAEMKFTSGMVEVANNFHYKMQPSESEVNKYNTYSNFRVVYIVVILVAIVGLSGLWTVRKVRKLMRQGRVEADTDQGQTEQNQGKTESDQGETEQESAQGDDQGIDQPDEPAEETVTDAADVADVTEEDADVAAEEAADVAAEEAADVAADEEKTEEV